MAEELNINTAMGAVNLFIKAVKNCRLYPETSDSVINSIETGYKRLTTVFYRNVPFVVSEAEGSILFDGKVLEPKSQRMPQITSLRVLMETLDLKSIIFDRGIDKQNYGHFSRILSLPPEEVMALGGVREIMDTTGVNYITVNHKLFVAAVYDSVIENDEDLFTHIWFRQASEPQALGYIFKKIGESAWVNSLGRRFLAFMVDKGSVPTEWEFISSLATLSGFLTKAGVEGDDASVFHTLYRSLNALGPYFNSDALALNLSDKTITESIDQLDDDSFVHLSACLMLIKRSHRRGSCPMDPMHLRLYSEASDWMLSLPRGIVLRSRVDALRALQERDQKKELVRIDVLIEALMDGDTHALNDLGVRGVLPQALTERVQQGHHDAVDKLIHAISLSINLDDKKQVMEAVRVLLHTAKAFARFDYVDMVSRVIVPLNFWVRYQQEITPLYEASCDMMVHHIHSLVVSGRFSESIPVVETFHLIEQGRLKKNEVVTQYANKVMERMASERVFNTALVEFRKNEKGRREHAAHFLTQLGKISVPPLLDLLRESEVMGARIRIMGVLQAIGSAALPEIMDRITFKTAWFYLRNLLKLLSEIGSTDQVDCLEPLILRSEDQVVDAMISCVKEIGGAKQAHFFSKAILQVSLQIKPRLANFLAQLGGDEAVYALSNVLRSKLMGTPEEKNGVILSACKALGEIGSMKALPALQFVVDQKGILGISRFTSEQKKIAEEMILKIRDAGSKVRTPSGDPSGGARVRVTDAYIDEEDFETLESVVMGLVSGEKRPLALKMLLLMVERASREKDFQRAEAYRSWLSDVDAMALGEAVKAEAIIGQEKYVPDSGEYMETWKALYAVLTEDEAASFYYHVKNESMGVDFQIISQGQVIDKLYFVNSGRLKIIYKDGPKETFIKEVGQGEVVGYDAFFRANVSTASLVALSPVNIGALDREGLKLLEKKYPAVSAKLQAFCGQFNNLAETVQAKGVERRRYKRFDVKGRVAFQLVTDTGETVGKAFAGTLIDISQGGISTEVKSSGYAMARLLLGRAIETRLKPGDPLEGLSPYGRVTSVNARGERAISIHIAFDRLMDISSLESFVMSDG